MSLDPSSILEDLDRRQNDVLEQLAALNTRVESLLKEHLAVREVTPGDSLDSPSRKLNPPVAVS